jgi:hypothetical protein
MPARKNMMGYKRPRKRRSNERYRVVVALTIFFLLIACMVFYTKSNQGSETNRKSMIDWNYLPKRINQELGRPTILGITVDKGATIKWQPAGEEDIIGYNLYRFKSQEDTGEKVNSAIILDTVYFDDDGSLFNSYSVTAVDTKGVEGPISETIAAIPEPVTVSGLQPTQPAEVMKDVTFTTTTPSTIPADVSDCTAPGMSYHGTWYLEHYPELFLNTLMVTPYMGDYMTYIFQGTQVEVVSIKHWNYGIMDIYIDGVLKGSADLYSSQVEVQSTVFKVSDLAPGAHTIKIVCSGYKNPQANFTFIAVDALKVK